MSHIPPRRRLIATLGVAAATTLALVASTGAAPALAQGHAAVAKPHKPKPPVKPNVKLQILAINDFHGQLEPSTSSSSGVINGTPAGGAEYLATHLAKVRAPGQVQRPAQRDRRRR